MLPWSVIASAGWPSATAAATRLTDPRRPVEHRVLGVRVQMDERRAAVRCAFGRFGQPLPTPCPQTRSTACGRTTRLSLALPHDSAPVRADIGFEWPLRTQPGPLGAAPGELRPSSGGAGLRVTARRSARRRTAHTVDMAPRTDPSGAGAVEDDHERLGSFGELQALVRSPIRGGDRRIDVKTLENPAESARCDVEDPCAVAGIENEKPPIAGVIEAARVRAQRRSVTDVRLLDVVITEVRNPVHVKDHAPLAGRAARGYVAIT